jgi:hypothetical protein
MADDWGMMPGEQDWDERAHLEQLKERARNLRASRRSLAEYQWRAAGIMAQENGLGFKRITEDHFRLTIGQNTYDLHVSPMRIIKPKNAPRLEVPKEWDLETVVRSAIRMAAGRP